VQIGVDSFAAAISDPVTGLTLDPVERMQHLLEEMSLLTASVSMFLASESITGPSSLILHRP
jgi:hypothetical protein